MTHAPALGRGETGDEADHRLRHIVLDPGRGLGLLRSADLADHQHGLGLGILLEQREMVEEGRAVDRIAADADRGGDADALGLHLRGGLVAERAGARDDADAALQIDVARHDAEHGLAGADDAGAVRPDHHRAAVFGIAHQIALHPHHVLRRDAVGDRADQPDAGIGRLHDGVGAEGRRHEGDGGGGAGLPSPLPSRC